MPRKADPTRQELLVAMDRAERMVLAIASRVDGSIPGDARLDLLEVAHGLDRHLRRAAKTLSFDPYYRTPAWRRLRDACLPRDRVCAMPGCTARSVVADSIAP